MARNPVIDASLGYLKQNYPNSRVTAFNDRNKGIGFKGLSDPPVIDPPVIDVSEFLEIGLPPESRFDVSDIPRPRTPAPPGLLENAAPTTEGFNVPNSMNSLLREGHFEGPHNIPSTPTINAEAPRELLSNMSDPRKQAFWGGLTQFGSELMTNPDGWGPGMSKFQQSLQAGRAQYKQEAIEAEERERKAAEDDWAERRVLALEGRLKLDTNTEEGRQRLAQNTFEENVRQFGLNHARTISQFNTTEERANYQFDLLQQGREFQQGLNQQKWDSDALTAQLLRTGYTEEQAATRTSRSIQLSFVKDWEKLNNDPNTTDEMKRSLIAHHMSKTLGMSDMTQATGVYEMLQTAQNNLNAPLSDESEKEFWYSPDGKSRIIHRYTEGDKKGTAVEFVEDSETGEWEEIVVNPSDDGWQRTVPKLTSDQMGQQEAMNKGLAEVGGVAHVAMVYGPVDSEGNRVGLPHGDFAISGATKRDRPADMTDEEFAVYYDTPAGWNDPEGYSENWKEMAATVGAALLNDPTGASPGMLKQIVRPILYDLVGEYAPEALTAHVEALGFINPIVRFLSGAQMTNQEAQRYYGALIPFPGEPAAVTYRKRLRRETLLLGMGLDPNTGLSMDLSDPENAANMEQASRKLGNNGLQIQAHGNVYSQEQIDSGGGVGRADMMYLSMMNNSDLGLIPEEGKGYSGIQPTSSAEEALSNYNKDG